jgi:hypothetical protein
MVHQMHLLQTTLSEYVTMCNYGRIELKTYLVHNGRFKMLILRTQHQKLHLLPLLRDPVI